MASSKILSRLSSRLQTVGPKLNKKSPSPELLSPPPLQKSTSHRISLVSRLPVELSSLQSTMPLHSAVASARLVSSLSSDTRSWGLIIQGISMPL